MRIGVQELLQGANGCMRPPGGSHLDPGPFGLDLVSQLLHKRRLADSWLADPPLSPFAAECRSPPARKQCQLAVATKESAAVQART
jgi:hypothetical protein